MYGVFRNKPVIVKKMYVYLKKDLPIYKEISEAILVKHAGMN